MLLLVLCSLAVAQTEEAPPPDLLAAREAFQGNLALGSSLKGTFVTKEQAEEVEALYQQAITSVQAYLRHHARDAEAHWLAGQIMCTAYRPAEVLHKDLTTGAEETRLVVGQGRHPDGNCEEGLEELRAALRLDKSNYDYMLDYAEAMLLCGDVAGCTEQCMSLWEARSKLSPAQAVRCASLLATTAREVMHPKEELRWLKEVVSLDPQQEKAVQRLGELIAADPGVTWLSFEAGRAVAQSIDRPMFVHFTADWCGWCRKLEQETYPDPKVVARLRQCVCVKVDGDRRRDLTSKYGVRGYPTTLVLHPSGHVLRTIVGYRPADDYAAELDEALKITIE
jgi:thioredoxin-like negative regulator of GroEL